jgi:glutathionylspermidine synthase
VLKLGPSLDLKTWRALRRGMELRHHKWDAQVGDEAGLSNTPLLMSRAAWLELAGLGEQLFEETRQAEVELLQRPELHARLGLPGSLRRLFLQGESTPAAARVMRFDFHWTTDGWRLSEVNSDVPGGYTEATHWARLVASQVAGSALPGDPTTAVVQAVARVAEGELVALLCAPGFMEDQQVVAHLAAALEEGGQGAALVSLEQLGWSEARAKVLAGRWAGRKMGAIFRFYQAEWLASRPEREHWAPLFVGGRTPVANPGAAALSESKRLPLLWDALATRLPTWRRLLPETRALSDAPWASDEGWLIKSAYCNTGDTVSMRSAMTKAAWRKRSWQARLRPGYWLAQRRFSVVPLQGPAGAIFPCVGVYVVNGSAAGAYARITSGPLIDFAASDAALLIYDER